jgi:predicted GNAT superfamily acetyltransferase
MIDRLELRPLSTLEDYTACVRLQRTTWGPNYTDIVPASLLKVSHGVGGIVAGAFCDDEMLGFVYGLAGVRHGRPIHWSHMLAVDPKYRNLGVGRRLKQYQRALLYEAGAEVAYWTFDPLQARNAHLNLNRLGATPREYVVNMYADTGSDLHAFGTDRFVVSWPVVAPDSVQSNGRQELPGEWRNAPVLNASPELGDAGADESSAGLLCASATVRVEIPADIESIAAEELDTARAWRSSTRAALLACNEHGFEVAGFFRDGHTRCYYVLTRNS